MDRIKRGKLIRRRMRKLFPAASTNIVPRAPTNRVVVPAKAKPRVRPTYPYGSAMADHVVSWIEEPDRRKKPIVVAPLKRRKGLAALNVISEKLKPGANIWPRPKRLLSTYQKG